MIETLSISYDLSKLLQSVCQFSDPIIAPKTNFYEKQNKTIITSLTRTCPSCPPVANFLSIASHSTQSTQPLCPDNTCEGVSVSRFHKRAFVSPDPVARREPVGENEAQRIGDVWPKKKFHDVRTSSSVDWEKMKKGKQTRECGGTSCCWTDTKYALRRTMHDNNILCSKITSWVFENINLDRFRDDNSSQCTRRCIFIFR